MQPAATAAPAKRPTPTLDRGTTSPNQGSSGTQDPALVSQLQARFDAMAIEESQAKGNDGQAQWAHGSGLDGKATGTLLDRHSTLLVLDGELQRMPWESIPSLQRHRCAWMDLYVANFWTGTWAESKLAASDSGVDHITSDCSNCA